MQLAIKNPRQINLALIICTLFVFLEMLDLSFINSTSAVIAQHFDIDTSQVDLLYLSFAIGATLILPGTNFFYQHWQLKSLLFQSSFLMIIIFLLSFFTSSWWWFCILRLLQGLLLTLNYSVIYIYSIDISLNKQDDINLINGSSILGLFLGPLIAAYLNQFNWRYIFFIFSLILIVSLILLVTVNFKRPLPNMHKSQTGLFSEYFFMALLLSSLALFFENSLAYYFRLLITLVFFIAFYQLYIRYYQRRQSFIFTIEVFNCNLLKALSFNFLVRNILALSPLFAYSLIKDYAISPAQIATLLSYLAIAALLAKIAYKKYAQLLVLLPMTILLGLTLGGFCYLLINSQPNLNFIYLSIIFICYGFASSILYNICNLQLYKNQKASLNNSLSLILTIIQTLTYGICTGINFAIYDFCKRFYSALPGLVFSIAISYLLLCIANLLKKPKKT